MPTFSVQVAGTSSPTKCPASTPSSPKWNIGLAQRSSRLSYHWLDRVVQPNLSYRYRQMWPTTKDVRHMYGNTMKKNVCRPVMPGLRCSTGGR